jgi:hypothetical protein
MSHQFETVVPDFIPRGRPADLVDQEWARALAARIGIGRAAKLVGCNRSSLANLAAGLPVYPGTCALVREARVRADAETTA